MDGDCSRFARDIATKLCNAIAARVSIGIQVQKVQQAMLEAYRCNKALRETQSRAVFASQAERACKLLVRAYAAYMGCATEDATLEDASNVCSQLEQESEHSNARRQQKSSNKKIF